MDDEWDKPLDTSTAHVRDVSANFLVISIKKLVGQDFAIAKECWRLMIEVAVERDHYAEMVDDLQSEILKLELLLREAGNRP